jgi:hypothetical protein
MGPLDAFLSPGQSSRHAASPSRGERDAKLWSCCSATKRSCCSVSALSPRDAMWQRAAKSSMSASQSTRRIGINNIFGSSSFLVSFLPVCTGWLRFVTNLSTPEPEGCYPLGISSTLGGTRFAATSVRSSRYLDEGAAARMEEPWGSAQVRSLGGALLTKSISFI